MEKRNRILSAALLTLGAVLAAVCLAAVFAAQKLPPVLLKQPQQAIQRAQTMLDALCSGDYDTASAQLLGGPAFGTLPEDTTSGARLLWEAYADSLSYTLGECYLTDAGLALDVTLRSLDLENTTQGLALRARELLEQRVAQATDSAQLYDRTNNFRRELVEEVLGMALQECLDGQAAYLEHTATLSFAMAEGSWWIVPDAALSALLSGACD